MVRKGIIVSFMLALFFGVVVVFVCVLFFPLFSSSIFSPFAMGFSRTQPSARISETAETLMLRHFGL